MLSEGSSQRHPNVSCLYLMHGVQQLGELVETLPVLAGVLLAFHNGFPQLLNVRHADLLEHRLTLQAVLRYCRRYTHTHTQCRHLSLEEVLYLFIYWYGAITFVKTAPELTSDLC